MTVRIPRPAIVPARWLTSAVASVGSPKPFRIRSPSQAAPARVPVPYTSVWKRYPAPRLVSATHVTGIFSFDAGAIGSDELWA